MRSHWKESVYDGELMTGYLEPRGKKMPLSAMTIGALADLGYEVDLSKADGFTVRAPASSFSSARDVDAPKQDKVRFEHVPPDWPILELKESDGVVEVKPGREEEFNRLRAAREKALRSEAHGEA